MPASDQIATVPDALRQAWQSDGTLTAAAVWTPLAGGRTNAVWRVDTGARSVVCKLHRREAGTPLFPNCPDAEALVLRALDGTGLAPRLVAERDTPLGPSMLLSHFPGMRWQSGDVAAVAHLLHRVHQLPKPPGLLRSECGAARLIAQGWTMLGDNAPGLPPDPVLDEPEPVQAVLLHGDPVPGNIIAQGDRLTLIDWQCPALGDPCDDIAIFLSPAMQKVNGNLPLTPKQIAAFLAAYGDPAVTHRYRALAPAYHWRMAAYCLWKHARGDAAYGNAAQLEIAALAASDH